MTNPSKANQRFEISALALGIELEIVSFPRETRTAKQAAHALQCELGQIVKSLVFECDGSAVLALTAGDHQVDTQRLGVLLGGSVGKADAKLVKEATGFSIGGVPPFGHVTQLQCLIVTISFVIKLRGVRLELPILFSRCKQNVCQN